MAPGPRYHVEYTSPARKQLDALPRAEQGRIVRATTALAGDPRPRGAEKIKGAAHQYRIRVGVYRVLYTIRDEVVTVLVLRIGHRKDVYRRR